MDTGIAVRYYRVERGEKHDPQFSKTLEKIFKLGSPSKRLRDVKGVKVRLEVFSSPSDGMYEGEFVRLQERAYPSEVHDESTAALQTERPLGHHIAFVFNEAKSVLAAQHDNKTLSLNRINGYLNGFPPHVWYQFTPLVRRDMWNRFVSSQPRKITFAIASPSDLADVGGSHKSVYQNLAEMADKYSPHLLEITMSMGQSNGFLAKGHDFVKDLLRRADEGEIDLRKLKGRSEGQAEEINLLEEVLTETITLDLPRNDPKESYRLRLEALHAGMARNHAKL